MQPTVTTWTWRKEKLLLILLLSCLVFCIIVLISCSDVVPSTSRPFLPRIATVWFLKGLTALVLSVTGFVPLFVLLSGPCARLFSLPTINDMRASLVPLIERSKEALKKRRENTLPTQPPQPQSVDSGSSASTSNRAQEARAAPPSDTWWGSRIPCYYYGETGGNSWAFGGHVVPVDAGASFLMRGTVGVADALEGGGGASVHGSASRVVHRGGGHGHDRQNPRLARSRRRGGNSAAAPSGESASFVDPHAV